MTGGHEARWLAAVHARREQHLLRQRRTLSGLQSRQVTLDNRRFLSFASNDYLGLASHPALQEAMIEATQRYGVGSGASHMVCGHHEAHDALERALASFTGRERALVFGSGYAANMAVLATLAGSKDAIVQDRLNHASLLDGAALSGAKTLRYQHADVDSLRQQLQRSRRVVGDKGQILVATDGVFSMDGDIAPLAKVSAVCREYDAVLVVDDAHGIGVLGPHGAGTLAAHQQSVADVPVLIGTFGKAFGTAGAFVAGSAALIEFLEQFARPYIYTTAMPPALASATLCSLKMLSEGEALRARLHSNIGHFREGCATLGLNLMASQTAIQPLLAGSSERVLALGAFLESQDMLTGQIRPPTVPQNTGRLRITLCASHTERDVARLLDALQAAQQQGLLPEPD